MRGEVKTLIFRFLCSKKGSIPSQVITHPPQITEMTPMKFTYDGWDYKILDAEKNDENVVEVTGVITMKDVGGRVVFDFTYGCDKDVYECHLNQAR